jgi:hypothetical protein
MGFCGGFSLTQRSIFSQNDESGEQMAQACANAWLHHLSVVAGVKFMRYQSNRVIGGKKGVAQG